MANVSSRYPIPAALTLEQTNALLPDPTLGIPIMDLAYLMINYPLSTPLPSPHPPLDTYFVQLVDAETAQSMKDVLAQGNITKMRAIFHAFLLSGRLAPPTPPGEPAHGMNPSKWIQLQNIKSLIPFPAAPLATESGWCGVRDNVDFVDAFVPENDAVVPSGVLRGAVKNTASGLDWLLGHKVLDELWDPYTEITYGFLNPDKATEYRRRRVRNALAWYNRNTSLTFRLVENIHTWDFGQPGRPNRNVLNNCNLRIYFGERDEWSKNDDSTVEHTVGWACIGQENRYKPLGADAPGFIPKWTSVYFNNQAINGDDELPPWDLESSNFTLYHELGHVISSHFQT